MSRLNAERQASSTSPRHPPDSIARRHWVGGVGALGVSLLLPIVGGAVVAMTIVCLVAQPVWGDQSWFLYAASRVLDGAQIGTDIVESNPPTIIWLSEIPVALSRLLGVLPQAAMKMCIGLLICVSVAWCASMVRRMDRAGSHSIALWLAIGIAYATTVYSWAHVGQREQFIVLLLLPYLVAAALRLEGISLTVWQGCAAGATALVALSMKPQHFAIVAGIEFLLVWRNGFMRTLVRSEAAGAIVAAVIYAAAVAIFAPDYITKIVALDYEAYLRFSRTPLVALLEPRRFAKIIVLLLLYALMRRRLEYRALGDVFAIAGIGATVGYLIQQKGWQNQFVPADVFFILLFGLMLVDGFTQWAPLRKARLRGRTMGTAALGSFLLVAAFYYPIQSTKAAVSFDPNRVPVQKAILGAVPTGTSVVVLGPNYSTVFDFVLDYHLIWASRLPSFWTLEAIFDGETGIDRYMNGRQLAALARWTRTAADEDLRRWRPSLVLVERCADLNISCGTSKSLREIDILRWFQEDPSFKAAWADYEMCREIGYYDVWYLKRDENACEALASVGSYPNHSQASGSTR